MVIPYTSFGFRKTQSQWKKFLSASFKKYIFGEFSTANGRTGQPYYRKEGTRRGRAEGIRQGHSLAAHPTWGRSDECSEITYTVREPSACSCGSANMVSASGDKSRWCTRSKNTIPSPSGRHGAPKPTLHLPLTPSWSLDRLGLQWPRLKHESSHSQLCHLEWRQGMETVHLGIRRENRASCEMVWSPLPAPCTLPRDRASSSWSKALL